MSDDAGTTWAGTHRYAARELVRPSSLDELRELVARASHVHALGSRHSFNDVADTPGVLVDATRLAALQPPVVSEDRRTVTVAGGATYADLAPWLHARGLALGAMASLPHVSVAGAVATATHGSGDAARCLSGGVAGLELLRSDGEVVTLRRGDPDLPGAVVSLGAIGVVLSVELDVRPTYELRQDVYEHLPWDALLSSYDEITAAAQSTSVFTRWGDDDVAQVWLKSLVPTEGPDAGTGSAPDDLLGARRALVDRHPLPGQSAATCTPQRGVPGPWFERLPHFRPEHTPSAGEEAQSEYLVPRAALPAAVEAVRPLAARLDPLLIMSELRTVAADDLWLSPAGERDVVALHFTFRRDVPAVLRLLPDLEAALLPLDARPHWGKLSCVDGAELARRYPRWSQARDLIARYDPRGAFAGPLTDRVGLTS